MPWVPVSFSMVLVVHRCVLHWVHFGMLHVLVTFGVVVCRRRRHYYS
jgi:hypothetical protein